MIRTLFKGKLVVLSQDYCLDPLLLSRSQCTATPEKLTRRFSSLLCSPMEAWSIETPTLVCAEILPLMGTLFSRSVIIRDKPISHHGATQRELSTLSFSIASSETSKSRTVPKRSLKFARKSISQIGLTNSAMTGKILNFPMT